MKKILLIAAVCAAMLVGSSKELTADIVDLANWTFETSNPTGSGSNNGPYLAESGLFANTSQASGFHATAATTWSAPAGNGSLRSFSSNNWLVGDYYQFTTSTLGYEGIIFRWDQTGSNTGPRDFILQYDIGNGFQDAFSYSIANDSWSTTTNKPESSRFFDFSAVTGMNDLSIVTFRLTMANSTTSINGGTVATGGTGRVDNVIIQGTAIPEPTAVLLLTGMAGLVGLKRRRV
jgi:hypothetical protein